MRAEMKLSDEIRTGDEIGQLNDWDYKDDPNKVQDSRYLHRGKMPWDLAAKITDADSNEAKIFAGLDQLERLRKSHKAFSAQADFWTFDTGSDQVLGLGRWLDGEMVLGLFHFGDVTHTVALPDGPYTDLLTAEALSGQITLNPGAYKWLLK